MKKKVLIVLLVTFLLSGCISKKDSVAEVEQNRPTFLTVENLASSVEVTPSVESYSFADDFSDTVNFSLINSLTDEAKDKLRNNYFVVAENTYNYEYFEVYEGNSYSYVPSFVTVDSLLHTFHLYYAYLQKHTEGNFLKDDLLVFSQEMYNNSLSQLEALKGSEWESAATRNVDYYAVAQTLLGGSVELSQNASAELASIDAQEADISTIFSVGDDQYLQDYSQFTPRGYYTESESLEQYFRAMMWFGQMNFTASVEDLNRSAILNIMATKGEALAMWEEVYMITAFFAGESDDNGYYEYSQLVNDAFGEDATEASLIGNDKAYNQFVESVKALPKPQINSMIVDEKEDRDEATIGYRVMGQRFTLDAAIMQRLVDREVPGRMMPDALDVVAGFGSERAYEILQQTGNVDIPEYKTNLETVRNIVETEGDKILSSCVSQAWLGLLRPLLEVKGEGYPQFMQNGAWVDKDINTFLGNYTELKHDTVLYAKQVMSELGADGGLGFVPPDDRGYVEPEPVVYDKLELLVNATIEGLQSRNLISDEDIEYMNNLATLAGQLRDISIKELNGELPTDEEFDLIKSYGGQLEHLWYKTVEKEGESSYETSDHPAALVTDIATNGQTGEILQLATGRADDIYVIVYFDGHPRICKGTTFSFYQFTSPAGIRLTDEEWRSQLDKGDTPDRPSWISSYFIQDAILPYGEYPVAFYNMIIMVNNSDVKVYFNPSMSEDVVGEVDQGTRYGVRETTSAEGYTWYCLGDHQWVPDGGAGWVTIDDSGF